jgi:hypothetical protein
MLQLQEYAKLIDEHAAQEEACGDRCVAHPHTLAAASTRTAGREREREGWRRCERSGPPAHAGSGVHPHTLAEREREREREKGGGGVRGVAHPHTLAAASTRTRWQRRPPAHAGSGARATRPFHRPAHGQRAAIRLLHPRHTALETATSKADPRQEHDWLFERLRGGRACHLEACGGRRSILLLSTRSVFILFNVLFSRWLIYVSFRSSYHSSLFAGSVWVVCSTGSSDVPISCQPSLGQTVCVTASPKRRAGTPHTGRPPPGSSLRP